MAKLNTGSLASTANHWNVTEVTVDVDPEIGQDGRYAVPISLSTYRFMRVNFDSLLFPEVPAEPPFFDTTQRYIIKGIPGHQSTQYHNKMYPGLTLLFNGDYNFKDYGYISQYSTDTNGSYYAPDKAITQRGFFVHDSRRRGDYSGLPNDYAHNYDFYPWSEEVPWGDLDEEWTIDITRLLTDNGTTHTLRISMTGSKHEGTTYTIPDFEFWTAADNARADGNSISYDPEWANCLHGWMNRGWLAGYPWDMKTDFYHYATSMTFLLCQLLFITEAGNPPVITNVAVPEFIPNIGARWMIPFEITATCDDGSTVTNYLLQERDVAYDGDEANPAELPTGLDPYPIAVLAAATTYPLPEGNEFPWQGYFWYYRWPKRYFDLWVMDSAYRVSARTTFNCWLSAVALDNGFYKYSGIPGIRGGEQLGFYRVGYNLVYNFDTRGGFDRDGTYAVGGALTMDTPNTGDAITFEITGGADAALFEIVNGSNLRFKVNATAAKSQYSVEVTATDEHLNTVVTAIAIHNGEPA